MPTKIDSLYPFNTVLEILASTQMARTGADTKIRKKPKILSCVNNIIAYRKSKKVKLFKLEFTMAAISN